MVEFLNAILVVILVLNLFTLGTSRIQSAIRMVAVQGALLALIPILIREKFSLTSVIASIVAVLLKGIVIPLIMNRSLRAAQIKREETPLIGLLPTVIIGAVITGLTLIFSKMVTVPDAQAATLIVPASFSTILVGFLLLITRYKAISQVLGYLVMENGIFIFGMLLVEAVPLIVEMGVLLDLFVGIFVISIITNHINRAFSSLDTRRLDSLKEE
jgi:hydrogenase-4 component E